MGGEKTESSSASMNPRGSPPRGRGKERRVVDHHPLPGITPAQAGKSRAWSWQCSRCRAHPRMGGEKPNSRRMSSCRVGSPPHRRGKGGSRRIVCAQIGITPAQAGKSANLVVHGVLVQDHPRVGGEKSEPNPMEQLQVGSPPHGRGKAALANIAPNPARITPAWAGKRRPQQRHRMALQDHPRAGGEKMVISTLTICSIGSPPRGRGKVLEPIRPTGLLRITPAWAGKRLLPNCTALPRWDHPRVGREKMA